MWNGVDFSQFGPFTIVFILMAIAIGFVVTLWRAERKRADDAINGRLQDAKDSRDAIVEPLNQAVSTTKLIYDLLTNSNNRGR